MALLDIGYTKWLSGHLWDGGKSLYADDESESEIKRIAFQLSIKNQVTIKKRNYKGTGIFLLYVCKNDFPVVPTLFYYATIDAIEGTWLYLSDVLSMCRSDQAILQGVI